MKPQQKLYAKVKNLRFRKDPSTLDPKNIIDELAEGEQVVFVDGPWLRVKVGNQEGWVHADYVSDDAPALLLRLGVPNLAKDALTIALRKEINDEYGGGKNGWELQCTEYATYRVKSKLGVTISWPVKSGRNGGKWGAIFQKNGPYKVSATPVAGSTMSFTTGISANPAVNEIGHVAFVEEVFPNESIKISEANWPRNGMYNERVLTKAEWKDKYKAQFVSYV